MCQRINCVTMAPEVLSGDERVTSGQAVFVEGGLSRGTTSARRRTLHLPARWPFAEAFLAAWRRLASLARVT